MLNEVPEGGMEMGFRVFLVGPYLYSLSLLPGIMVTLRSRAEWEQAILLLRRGRWAWSR